MNAKILSINLIIALMLILSACNDVKQPDESGIQKGFKIRPTTSTTPTTPTKKFKMVALVIGNADYKFAPLKNPVNDAEDLTAVLKKLGFDEIDVISIKNASYQTMDTAINQFKRKLGKNVIGLFYFSGHGVQYENRNYMIPADMPELTVSKVKFNSVPIEYVLATMEEANNQVNLIILDACRNNPFKGGNRGVRKGLAQVTAPTGSLIAYATSPGEVAQDGSGRNSPYTKSLKKFLLQPGLTIEKVFKNVRNAVRQDTYEKQTPWESTNLYGDDIYLAGKVTHEEEEEKRRLAEKRRKQDRLAEERRKQDRLAEERRKQDRLAEQEKRRKEQDRLADEEKRLVEKRRLRRLSKERRLVEEKRLAEERLAEEPCKGCNCKEIRQQESLGFEQLTTQQEVFKKTCEY